MIEHVQWAMLFAGVTFGLAGLTVGLIVGVGWERKDRDDHRLCTCTQIHLALDDMRETRTPAQYVRSLETLNDLSPRSVRCRLHGTQEFDRITLQASRIGVLTVVEVDRPIASAGQ